MISIIYLFALVTLCITQTISVNETSTASTHNGASTPTTSTDTNRLNETRDRLIQEVLDRGIKITRERVIRIWNRPHLNPELPANITIIWMEFGGPGAGYNHIKRAHGSQFNEAGIPPHDYAELVQAATTVGLFTNFQGRRGDRGTGRAVYLLYFHGRGVAVAITIGTNGFVVGMNPTTYGTELRGNITDRVIQNSHSWPLLGSGEGSSRDRK